MSIQTPTLQLEQLLMFTRNNINFNLYEIEWICYHINVIDKNVIILRLFTQSYHDIFFLDRASRKDKVYIELFVPIYYQDIAEAVLAELINDNIISIPSKSNKTPVIY